MQVGYHKNFKKAYKKLPRKIQKAFLARIQIFYQNPLDPILNNHFVSGKYKGYRSINVTGDYRALYASTEKEQVRFMEIGTHSHLYG